jgi:uncharacterized protein (TIRG00374 family)
LRPAATRIARIAVAGGLTAFFLWKSHPRDVLAAAAGADWRPITIAVLLVFLDRVLMAYRWVVLLYTLDPATRPPLGEILRVFFTSTFVGSFLPSVGGDAIRAYAMTKLHISTGDAVASVFMDRMLGIASLLLMALLGLAVARDLAGGWVIVSSLGLAAAACVITLLLVFSRRMAAVASSLLGWLPGAMHRAGHGLIEAIQRYAAHHPQLAQVLIGSIVVQVLRILQAYYLGRGLGIEAPLVVYVAVLPAILLVMLVPVTVNGFGTGQAAFVWFFARAGVAAAPAFALSLLFIGLGVIGNLPGGVLYALGAEAPAKRASL